MDIVPNQRPKNNEFINPVEEEVNKFQLVKKALVKECSEIAGFSNYSILLAIVEKSSNKYFFFSSTGTPQEFIEQYLINFPRDENIEILNTTEVFIFIKI